MKMFTRVVGSIIYPVLVAGVILGLFFVVETIMAGNAAHTLTVTPQVAEILASNPKGGARLSHQLFRGGRDTRIKAQLKVTLASNPN